MVRFDTVRRSRFGALWDGILRFVGFGYGGSGTIRLGWVWFRAVRFDMAVKEGQLSAGRDEFRLVMAVRSRQVAIWSGAVYYGKSRRSGWDLFRRGGLRFGTAGCDKTV